jgi:hypothetical protein
MFIIEREQSRLFRRKLPRELSHRLIGEQVV